MPIPFNNNQVKYIWSVEYYKKLAAHQKQLVEDAENPSLKLLQKPDFTDTNLMSVIGDVKTLEKLSVEVFATRMVQSKKRIYVAEGQDQSSSTTETYSWHLWSSVSADILSNLVTVVDVEIPLTGQWLENARTLLAQPHAARYIFLNARTLTQSKTTSTEYVNHDYNKYIKKYSKTGQLTNEEKQNLKTDLKNDLKANILAALQEANHYGARTGTKRIITSSSLGAGSFAGDFKTEAGEAYMEALNEVLAENTFDHIKACILDIGRLDISENKKNDLGLVKNQKIHKATHNNTTLITRIRSLSGTDYPELQRDAQWYINEYQLDVDPNEKYGTDIVVNADLLAWLANEGLIGSSTSNEGQIIFTSNIGTVVYGVPTKIDGKKVVPSEYGNDWDEATKNIDHQPTNPEQIYIQLGKHIIKSRLLSTYFTFTDDVKPLNNLLDQIIDKNGAVKISSIENFPPQAISVVLAHLIMENVSAAQLQAFTSQNQEAIADSLDALSILYEADPASNRYTQQIHKKLEELATKTQLNTHDITALLRLPIVVRSNPEIENKINAYLKASSSELSFVENYLPYLHHLPTDTLNSIKNLIGDLMKGDKANNPRIVYIIKSILWMEKQRNVPIEQSFFSNQQLSLFLKKNLNKDFFIGLLQVLSPHRYNDFLSSMANDYKFDFINSIRDIETLSAQFSLNDLSFLFNLSNKDKVIASIESFRELEIYEEISKSTLTPIAEKIQTSARNFPPSQKSHVEIFIEISKKLETSRIEYEAENRIILEDKFKKLIIKNDDYDRCAKLIGAPTIEELEKITTLTQLCEILEKTPVLLNKLESITPNDEVKATLENLILKVVSNLSVEKNSTAKLEYRYKGGLSQIENTKVREVIAKVAWKGFETKYQEKKSTAKLFTPNYINVINEKKSIDQSKTEQKVDAFISHAQQSRSLNKVTIGVLEEFQKTSIRSKPQ